MNGIDREKVTTGDSYRGLCLRQGLPYSSLMRWRRRQRHGVQLVLPRGPDRLPLNVAELWDRVRSLRHGRRRTFGAPAVFPAFRNQIVRRHVRALVRSVRQDFHRELADSQRRIDWRAPGLIWSMDDLERRDLGERPVFWHQTQDLSSRFKFTPPVGSHLITGAAIAKHLRGLFRTYGAPLFFKRDNGGNLNSAEVNALFDEYLVIPLNSPSQYPPYNGGIEEAQREFQDALEPRLASTPVEESSLLLTTEVIANELNHKPRPCLDGDCSCVRFFAGRSKQKNYNRTERKEVYRQIFAIVEDMMKNVSDDDERTAQAVWRRAVETWLQDHDMIRIKEPEECNPVFS